MRLDNYSTGAYTPGAPYWAQLLWYFVGAPLVRSYWLPLSGAKVSLLRWFGAQVGVGVRIKPGLQVKFPWRLVVGNYVWLGEKAWLDNLAEIRIDDHVCISQGVYLGTGNHDWSKTTFDLRLGSIHVEQSSWLGAHTRVGPGVTIGQGAVLCLGSVATQSLKPMTIYAGHPAQPIKMRQMVQAASVPLE